MAGDRPLGLGLTSQVGEDGQEILVVVERETGVPIGSDLQAERHRPGASAILRDVHPDDREGRRGHAERFRPSPPHPDERIGDENNPFATVRPGRPTCVAKRVIQVTGPGQPPVTRGVSERIQETLRACLGHEAIHAVALDVGRPATDDEVELRPTSRETCALPIAEPPDRPASGDAIGRRTLALRNDAVVTHTVVTATRRACASAANGAVIRSIVLKVGLHLCRVDGLRKPDRPERLPQRTLAAMDLPIVLCVDVRGLGFDHDVLRRHVDLDVLGVDTRQRRLDHECSVLLAHFNRGLPHELPLRRQPVAERVGVAAVAPLKAHIRALRNALVHTLDVVDD